ncbi:FecR family protein [Halalkalibaculum sp. DA384]|uniref:FecR family protein n=1 Tax=Halalkalibaculum sp. DA384 TaxID=3373606 RepID=UPI0037542A28
MTKHHDNIHKRRWEKINEDPLEDVRRKRIKNRIRQTLSFEEDPVKATSIFSLSRTYMAAASLLILVAVCVGLFINFNASSSEQVMTKYSTTVGETRSITLPDGSNVWLNAESNLRVQAGYNEQNRRVALEGEAYFEVAPDPDRPFQVQSDDLLTQVLGTRFNIRSYRSDPVRQVTVTEGKVRVKKATKNEGINVEKQSTVDLGVGEQLEIRPSDDRLIKKKVAKADRFTSWRKGILLFEKTTLRQVADELYRRFGITMLFADPELTNTRITGRFDDENWEEIIEMICISTNLGYKTVDSTATIHRTKTEMKGGQ